MVRRIFVENKKLIFLKVFSGDGLLGVREKLEWRTSVSNVIYNWASVSILLNIAQMINNDFSVFSVFSNGP